MDQCKVYLVTMLVVALLSATLVCGRPRQVNAETQDLVGVASDLTHALETVVDTLQSKTRRSRRRRRFVHYEVNRHIYNPRSHRQRRPKPVRDANISDH